MSRAEAAVLACTLCAWLLVLPPQPAAAQIDRDHRDSTAHSARFPEATIGISATVYADELVFDALGSASLRFTGTSIDTLRLVDISGLPETVEPGVVYRNVSLRLEFSATLDEDEILSLLLGAEPTLQNDGGTMRATPRIPDDNLRSQREER